MLRFLCGLGLAVVVSACSSSPKVFAAADLDVTSPTGRIESLSRIVKLPGPVRVIFIHGVGDTCAGYALDEKRGWLNNDAIKYMGMTRANDRKSDSINLSVFTRGEPDPQAEIDYASETFLLKLQEPEASASIEMVEITWSPLTQWIKTGQLAYDSPSIFAQPDENTPCLLRPGAGSSQPTFPPPERLALNQLVKELILNRNLADAMIYASPYRDVIERGVAEALCRVVSGYLAARRHDIQPCQWPDASARDPDPTQYIFVTHSLGSRILYDVTLNLTGHPTSGRPNPFDCDTLTRSIPMVNEIVAHTPVIYMMANQLSLIGVTNVSYDARSTDGALPRIALPRVAQPECGRFAEVGVVPTPLSPSASLLAEMTALHAQAVSASRDQSINPSAHTLRLVAFSDTNDLLTWHITRPYQAVRQQDDESRFPIDFVNVFVQNDEHLVVFENPRAHNDYFKRFDVWQTIWCGAEQGHVLSC